MLWGAMKDETTAMPADQNDPFGLSAVRDLLQMLEQSDVYEITIERGNSKLHVKRGQPTGVIYSAPMSQPVPAPIATPLPTAPVTPFVQPPPAPEGPPVEMPAGHTITAPMVGTFYAAPSPKDKPFVQEGDEVRVGDTVGIIEAMKMMNEIESDVAGRVARILVKNGQPVEYGQPLMVIEPL
ncbi:acetyl-CoA carboxylase, biotin carboxyl carrier protein [Chloroflexus aggregans DSM 9485]|uniref:Biotin carboxyl carrier protein of acetyl-CoA carboxylase n=2 Tax=Chloroflexus aggregans TaxID=152260 RepID=B8G696_CHLAD|nr:acetyl-CoA carboxylase, biotin carboxyl carrier protein [Chloroflexus aggregans DSM 9485]